MIALTDQQMGVETLADFGGRWVQVVSHVDPKYGGLSAMVPALTRQMARAGYIDVSLAAFTAAGEDQIPEGLDAESVSFFPVGRKQWLRESSLRDRFRQQVSQIDGLHIHGLWEQSTAIGAATARAQGIPYIVSAHGMLEPWALNHKRIKKLIYAHLTERKNVGGATCLHALTHAEANQYVKFGARCPIAVIPNGVTIPSRATASLFLSSFPQLQGKRIVLFLSRLNRKKGVELLVESWAQCAGTWPDAHLVLAGPDTEGTQAELERSVSRLGLQSSVSFPGMLRGDMKWSALAAAECFVLPSHSEGLSVSVLEAMGMGLPVIVTHACNMPEVSKAAAGWQIDADVNQLSAALIQALSNSNEDNCSIGQRGAALIAREYNWPAIASKMVNLYRWVLQSPGQRSANPVDVEMVLP